MRLDIQEDLIFKDALVFDWDRGNRYKNKIKHDVNTIEAEEIFIDKPVYFKDLKHSDKEKRWYMLGFSKKIRILKIVFTYRKEKVRIISARDASKKEKKLYYQFI